MTLLAEQVMVHGCRCLVFSGEYNAARALVWVARLLWERQPASLAAAVAAAFEARSSHWPSLHSSCMIGYWGAGAPGLAFPQTGCAFPPGREALRHSFPQSTHVQGSSLQQPWLGVPPCRLKLDGLFLQWFSLPDSQQLVRGSSAAGAATTAAYLVQGRYCGAAAQHSTAQQQLGEPQQRQWLNELQPCTSVSTCVNATGSV